MEKTLVAKVNDSDATLPCLIDIKSICLRKVTIKHTSWTASNRDHPPTETPNAANETLVLKVDG